MTESGTANLASDKPATSIQGKRKVTVHKNKLKINLTNTFLVANVYYHCERSQSEYIRFYSKKKYD